MELILKYFPELSEKQTEQFRQLDVLYHDWNAKINVISRKDIDNLYEHHVLHSLGIAEFTRFKSGTEIMDLGTGGGFPGIPLAIMFPDCHFHLVDSIGKKIKAVSYTHLDVYKRQIQYFDEIPVSPSPGLSGPSHLFHTVGIGLRSVSGDVVMLGF